MRLGYACVNTRLPSSARTLRLARVTPARLRELIASNLDALEAILRWNADHGIQVFRLTSNLIPFGSHAANELAWWDEFAPRFAELGRAVRDGRMRLSTHPGQYTVLSSARPEVVSAAIAELDYHDRLLTALGLDRSHKIVLHVGSGAAVRAEAYERFAAGFARLSPGAAARLVVENDERWPLEDVLALAERLRLPVVFDAFHHELAPSFEGLATRGLVLRAGKTWRAADGRQEVHFSTQEPGKRPGAHAETIDLDALASFVDAVGDLPLDCILEVKDKERSVLRARELRRGSRRPSGRDAPPAHGTRFASRPAGHWRCVSKVLLVTTVSGSDDRLREDLRGVLDDADVVRVVAPAADVSWLDWLTNAEDDARAEARRAAIDAAGVAADGAAVEIDRTSQDTDAAQAVLDALRTFEADEVVVVTRPDEESTWLETEALEAAVAGAGVPVRHVELPEGA